MGDGKMRAMGMALLLALAACDAGVARPSEQQAGKRADVTEVASNDVAMNAAKAKGRATLPQFLALLRDPPAGTDGYAVKYGLTSDAGTEFIWASDLRLSAGTLVGKLANEPIAPNFKLDQQVTIPQADIIDWAYVKDGAMQGHHTTRALLAVMPAEQAAQIREAFGWR